VTVDNASKTIHRGSYTLAELRKELDVADGRELDVIEDGKIRAVTATEHITVKEGMQFVTRQPSGGAS
jgi:hypothetical protein